MSAAHRFVSREVSEIDPVSGDLSIPIGVVAARLGLEALVLRLSWC